MRSLPIPVTQELRTFGLLMGAAITVVFGVVVPWLSDSALPIWPWLVAVILVGLAWFIPLALKPIHRAWMQVAYLLNWLISRVTLVLVYYGVVVSMGMVMRMLKKDPMRRRFEPEAATYRVPSDARDRKHLERPF